MSIDVATSTCESPDSASALDRQSRRVVGGWAATIGLALLPVVLAVSFYFWPVVRSFPHALLPVGDGSFYVYQLGRMPELNGQWWRLGEDSLLGAPYATAASRNPGLYEGVDVLLLSSVTAWLFGPVWNYYVLAVLILAFNGWVAAGLVHHLTHSYLAAVLAVVLITINQGTMVRVSSHFHLFKYGWFLLGCWAFSRYLDVPSWRRGLVLGLSVAMTVQGSFYFGYLLIVGLGVWWLGCLAAGQLRLDHAKSAGLAALSSAALTAALTFPVWSRPVTPEYQTRGLAQTWVHGAELWQYATPPGSLRGGTRLAAAQRDGLTLLNGMQRPRNSTQQLVREFIQSYGTTAGNWCYLGGTVLAGLAIFAILRLRGVRIVAGDGLLLDRTAGLFAVFIVLSLAGGPSVWLYGLVPCFRCYARAGLIAMALGCVVTPVAMYAAITHFRSNAIRIALCGILLILVTRDLRITHHLRLRHMFEETPSWVTWLAAQPAEVRLVAFANDSEHDVGWFEEWSWASAAFRMIHHHATLNGAAVEPLSADLQRLGCSLDQMNPAGLQFLASRGYDTFAFESGYLDRQQSLRDLPWLEQIEETGGWSYYRCKKALPAAIAQGPRTSVR